MTCDECNGTGEVPRYCPLCNHEFQAPRDVCDCGQNGGAR
jgi:hypothetical protein